MSSPFSVLLAETFLITKSLADYLGRGRYRNRDFMKGVPILLAVHCCETLKPLCYKSA